MSPSTSFSQMYDRAIHFPKNNPVFLKLSATLNDTFRLILFTVWGESSDSVHWTSQQRDGGDCAPRPDSITHLLCKDRSPRFSVREKSENTKCNFSDLKDRLASYQGLLRFFCLIPYFCLNKWIVRKNNESTTSQTELTDVAARFPSYFWTNWPVK